MFPHRKIHKYTWTSPDSKTQKQIDHVFVDRKRQSSVLDVLSFRGTDCDTDLGDNMDNVRREASRTFRTKKKGISLKQN
jgi:hypothetical protein